jgi:hypothetical protein
VGLPFTYEITASGAPVGYAVVGLPAGLVFDPAAGLISGAPAASGVFTVNLTASNAGGSGQLALALSVAAPPSVTLELLGNADVAVGGKGKVLFTRAGDDESRDLPVSYLIKGTAKNGKDFEKLDGTVTIPAGASTFKLNFKTFDRVRNQTGETIILKLAPSPTGAYLIANPKKAIITILEKD